MRNAGLVLGIIAGSLGMIVGFFGYGYVELVNWLGEVPDVAEQVANPARVRTFSLLAPVLCIAGAAMTRSYAQVGGVLMLASSAAMYWVFGFGVFTMFPIAMAGLGGVLAVAAIKPDPH